MLIYEELLQKLKELKPQIDNLNEALNLKEAEALVKKLEEESSKEDFWSDLQHSQKVLQEIKANKDKIAAFNSLLSEYDDAEAMIEIADGEEDESYVPEISESIAKLEKDISEQRLATLKRRI